MTDRPDPATLDLADLGAALRAPESENRHASVTVDRDDVEDVPDDVASWWRAAFRRRLQVVRAEPLGPVFRTALEWLTDDGEIRGEHGASTRAGR
jgi:hypothetical protein